MSSLGSECKNRPAGSTRQAACQHVCGRKSAHAAQRGNLVFHAVQATVFARPDHFAATTEVRIAAHFPLALVDDDGRGAVIEVVAHQVFRIAVQRQRFAAHARFGEQQDGAALLVLRLLVLLILLLLAPRFALVNHARRRDASIEATSKVVVTAGAEDAAHAVIVRVAAQLPVAVVDDDAGGAVVETDADEIVRIAVQARRAAILSRARIHLQRAATAIAAIATVWITSRTPRIVAIATA